MTREEYIKLVNSYMEKANGYVDELRDVLGKSIQLSTNLFEAFRREHDAKIRMKSIIERLAPEECITEEHDHFSHSISCVFCHAELLDDKEPHRIDCPWIEARKLLEELK